MSERDIKSLLAAVERALGREWVEIAEWLREQNDLDAIEERLLAGDFRGLVAQIEDAARRFATATQAQFARAGQAAADWLDAQPSLADRIIRFDATHERAVAAARRNELELVRGLSLETRETVRAVLVDGQINGKNPRSMARDIRDSIGLTPTQTQHVLNYRRALESGDFANALGRELRDARSDRMLRRLADEGGQLTEQQIDRMVERYRAAYVSFRAEVIARTESARNVHAGLQEAYTQAVERGDIEADQLVREWVAAPPTPNAREQHQAMDGQQRKLNEPFVAPDGTPLMYPGDGPPKHSANCRCTVAATLQPARSQTA